MIMQYRATTYSGSFSSDRKRAITDLAENERQYENGETGMVVWEKGLLGDNGASFGGHSHIHSRFSSHSDRASFLQPLL